MINWLNLTEEQRKLSLEQAALKLGTIPKAIEKDWWVTLTLKALFETPFKTELIFKGGTSLSKCWKLIDRFSEDIDIAMSPTLFGMEYHESPGSGYLNRLKRRGCAFTSNELKNALEKQFEILGLPKDSVEVVAGEIPENMKDKDPQELFIRYKSLFDPNPYLLDEVKIEVSVRSKLEPYTGVAITSLLQEYFPNEAYNDEPFIVLAVEPHKTFLEKAFLLHEQFHRDEETVIKTDRMSRHYHDLVKMQDTEVCERALNDSDLYVAIVKHRSYYNKLKGLDYKSLQRDKIDFVPPNEMIEAYQKDYEAMRENMIYGESVDPKKLFEKIGKLKELFRNVK